MKNNNKIDITKWFDQESQHLPVDTYEPRYYAGQSTRDAFSLESDFDTMMIEIVEAV